MPLTPMRSYAKTYDYFGVRERAALNIQKDGLYLVGRSGGWAIEQLGGWGPHTSSGGLAVGAAFSH